MLLRPLHRGTGALSLCVLVVMCALHVAVSLAEDKAREVVGLPVVDFVFVGTAGAGREEGGPAVDAVGDDLRGGEEHHAAELVVWVGEAHDTRLKVGALKLRRTIRRGASLVRLLPH